MRKWASPLRRRSTRRWRSKSPEGIGATGFLAHDRVSDDPPDRSRLTWSDDLLGRTSPPEGSGHRSGASPRRFRSVGLFSTALPFRERWHRALTDLVGGLLTSLGSYRPRWVFTERRWVPHPASLDVQTSAPSSPITFIASRKSLFLNAFCRKGDLANRS